ncbi:MAG: hypothetical protein AB7I79_21210 [Rhizobiaceae bacterium]
MTFRVLMLALAGGTAVASVAKADPVTYKGTLGMSDIVVEFTADPSAGEPVAGRYAYASQGVDIPLQPKTGGRTLTLDEEAPCGSSCPEGEPGPVGATWTLSTADDGGTLTGQWAGAKTHEIRLTRVGARRVEGEQPTTPRQLADFSFMAFYANDTPITIDTSPYDFLKLDVPMQDGAVEGWPDASFRYVVDPRTKFPMPRIVEPAGGASTEAANAVLWQRHAKSSLAALSCASMQYSGFQENGQVPDVEGGSLGGFDGSTSTVLALTTRLMSWTESGSVYCGGAHPHNYGNSYTMNVATGALLGLGDMFSDVVDGKPGANLLAFVELKRGKPSGQVAIDFEEQCGTGALIADYLVAKVRREGDELSIVFGLQDLPHAINACGDDVMRIPVAEVEPLLKPDFAALLGK